MEELKCPLCDYIFTKERKGACFKSLESHLRNMHNLKFKAKDIPKRFGIDEEFLLDRREMARAAAKAKWRTPEYTELHNNKLKDGMDKHEYDALPECQICGFKAPQLYKHVSCIHDMPVDLYKTKYPFSKLETDEYIHYLSESRTGEKNPQYGKGKSELSPWSVEFYKAKGYDEEESIKMKQDFIEHVKNIRSPESQPTRVEYYMNKYNVSELSARLMRRERQSTNSIENIAKRNGISIEDATVIRDEITDKWLQTLNDKPLNEIAEMNAKKSRGCKSVSNVSMRLFNKVIEQLDLPRDEINVDDNELAIGYILPSGKKSAFIYDFAYKHKLIEFNGDLFHANPLHYNGNDMPLKRLGKLTARPNITAAELWEHDKLKRQIAEDNGYQLLVIWEWDVRYNIDAEISKCVDFLTS